MHEEGSTCHKLQALAVPKLSVCIRLKLLKKLWSYFKTRLAPKQSPAIPGLRGERSALN